MKSYFISFNGVDYSQFYPSNDPKVIWKPEAGEIFMRYSIDELSVPRTTNAAVYDTLESYFFDDTKFGTTLNFKIRKSGVDKYFFRMSVNEGKIDSEKKVFKCTPRTNDAYQDIMDVYDKKFVESGNGMTGDDLPVYVLSEITPFVRIGAPGAFTFSDIAHLVTWDNGDAVVRYAGITYTGASGVNITAKILFDTTSFSGDSLLVYLADAGGGALSAKQGVGAATTSRTLVQTVPGTIAYIYAEFPAGDSGTFEYRAFQAEIQAAAGGLLQSIITRILTNASYLNLSYSVVSTYLWNSALGSDPPPNIKTYITANPTKDYVVEGTAIWNLLILAKTHNFTIDKTSTSYSLKDIMDILKIKLRAWWYIDADGKFRIEHEKYFTDYAAQLDVTAQDKAETDRSIYNYDKGDIASVISYKETNELTSDFVAYPVIYDSELTTPATRSIIASLSTDITNILDGSPSSEGMTLLQCFKSGIFYHVDIAESIINPGEYYANQRLSWAYLFANYWDYFGEADSADINNGDTLTLITVKRFLKQEGIKFYYSGELLWYKPVTLKNGLGWMTQWEESEDEYLTINVGFDPYL